MRSTVTSTFAKIIAIIEDENLTKEGREKKRDVYDMMGMLQKRVSRNENLWHFYLWHFASSEQPQLRRKTPRDLFHNWSPFINTRIFIVNFIFGVYNKHFWPKKKYIFEFCCKPNNIVNRFDCLQSDVKHESWSKVIGWLFWCQHMLRTKDLQHTHFEDALRVAFRRNQDFFQLVYRSNVISHFSLYAWASTVPAQVQASVTEPCRSNL